MGRLNDFGDNGQLGQGRNTLAPRREISLEHPNCDQLGEKNMSNAHRGRVGGENKVISFTVQSLRRGGRGKLGKRGHGNLKSKSSCCRGSRRHSLKGVRLRIAKTKKGEGTFTQGDGKRTDFFNGKTRYSAEPQRERGVAAFSEDPGKIVRKAASSGKGEFAGDGLGKKHWGVETSERKG